MRKIKIKVADFNENDNSLLVSVASDETSSNNPEDYGALAYQPLTMWPDESDTTKLLRNLAYANLHIAEQRKLLESVSDSDPRIQWMKSIKGQEFEFDVEELINSFR